MVQLIFDAIMYVFSYIFSVIINEKMVDVYWHEDNAWRLFVVKHIQFNGSNIITGVIRHSESRI